MVCRSISEGSSYRNDFLFLPHSFSSNLILHRLKTVSNADQTPIVDKGRGVQKGRHEELIIPGPGNMPGPVQLCDNGAGTFFSDIFLVIKPSFFVLRNLL